MKSKHATLAVIFLSICSANAVETYDGIKLGSTNTVSNGSNSIALGTSNSANHSSIALGFWSDVDWASLSAGYYNFIGSDSSSSLAAGEYNSIFNSVSTVVLGDSNTVTKQWGSAAIGLSNLLPSAVGKEGYANILLGFGNKIDQSVSSAPTLIEGTVLLGVSNESTSTMAFAFGRGNIGQTDTVTLGTYAQTVSNASLIVGKGTSGSARSNGLVVLKNGEVQIAGSLVVGGSPTLTQSSAPSYMTGQGFVNTSYLSNNGYIKKANGLNSTASSTSAFAIGELSNAMGDNAIAVGQYAQALGNGAIALGNEGIATGTSSISLGLANAYGDHTFAAAYGVAGGAHAVGIGGFANGVSSVAIGGFDIPSEFGNVADGKGSSAIGGNINYASGEYSYAMGNESNTFGNHSFALGFVTRSSAYEFVIGSKNLNAANAMPNAHNTNWVEEGGLFELGNGDATNPAAPASNAITTLKNGRTTLTNKAWKANVAANATQTLADPPATTDSAGEALVVEGHTRLRGKVVIETAQGDISMGLYQ